jgi:signal transduction histidine kinase/DNA-binding NarL/FixJ family response regulator
MGAWSIVKDNVEVFDFLDQRRKLPISPSRTHCNDMVAPIPLLLLEDNEADACFLMEMLEDADDPPWQVTHAKCLANALEHLKNTQFDIALLDLSLPDSKGLETLTRVQSVASDLPIVVLTGLDDREISFQAVAQGAQDYLVKGQISAEILIRVIHYAIERGRILRQLQAEVAERQRSEQTLRLIVEGTVSVTGAAFFRALARSLAEALNVRYALISGCIDTPPTRVCTYAFWQGNEFGENVEYDLYGTPCEKVFGTQGCQYYPAGVQALFPQDQALVEMQAESYVGIPLFSSTGKLLGHLAVLDDKMIGNEPRNTAILEIFAARAASEIERQQAEEALQKANKALEKLAEIGELASMIVHEIRNPLTTLLMGLNAFKRLELPERYQTYRSLALDEGERLQRLLNQILLYAKPHNLVRSEVELNHFVAEMLSTLREMPAATGKHLRFTAAPSPIKIQVDPDKLKQVIINLVANAFEAVEEADEIELSLHPDAAHQVCLQVHNGGMPIPLDVLPKLTKPFVTTKSSGTGLGLAIVKRIVEAHSGELSIESSVAAGTTITVKLPIALPS